jgi:hypothetical protein
MKFFAFFLFMWLIYVLLDPDPDSKSGTNDLIEPGSNPDPDMKRWEKHQIIGKELQWRKKNTNIASKYFITSPSDWPSSPQSGGWLESRCKEDSTTPETRTGSFSSCSSSSPASTPRYWQLGHLTYVHDNPVAKFIVPYGGGGGGG